MICAILSHVAHVYSYCRIGGCHCSMVSAGKGLVKGGLGSKPVYGQPQFRVLHWVKASKGLGTVWCDVPDPLPELPGPQHHALARLFGVKPAAQKPATGMACLQQSQKPFHHLMQSSSSITCQHLNYDQDYSCRLWRAPCHALLLLHCWWSAQA